VIADYFSINPGCDDVKLSRPFKVVVGFKPYIQLDLVAVVGDFLPVKGPERFHFLFA
jgi:hypothetical protein